MKPTKYSIGLDIGTNSVGWAVVDEHDQLVKVNRKTLWGVRMFEESKDASERRTYRNSRRRLNRRHQRIQLLRELFNEEIKKVDPTFFERLDDSFYHMEDKRNKNYYNLFNDSYTDKDYYHQFPTIFHLRDYLMNSTKKEDIRFLYLACHHIIKYRGNFLVQGDVFNKGNIDTISSVFNDLNNLLVEYAAEYQDDQEYFARIQISEDFYQKLEEIMLASCSKTERKARLLALFGVEKKTLVNECIIPLLVKSNYDFSKILVIKEMKYEKCDITLMTEELESALEEKSSIVPEFSDLILFGAELKKIIDYYYLLKLLNNTDSISKAMIQSFNQHKNDLERLKSFIRTYAKDKYYECFRKYDQKLNNYVHYVGMNSTNKTMKRFGHCKREDFYKYLNTIFKSITDKDAKEDIQYFQLKIENNEFLLRQDNDQNGSIPMQLHLAELRTILQNQKQFYPFLSAMEDELSTMDKIEAIFKFKLPYYVGPLNASSPYSWVNRTNEKIYPWNLEKVVNLDETAKKFIERMQNKCTYLKGANDYCLPANSLVFSEYNCLSYLNKISINGQLISNEMKNELFNNTFLKKKKPSKKDIIQYITAHYGEVQFTNNKNELPEVNCDMSSYIKFKEIFGDEFDSNKDLIERIIKDICIFEDKSILAKRLKDIYQLDTDKIRKIKDLNYSKYGRLSNKLLNELLVSNPETGEVYGTVLDVMRATNMNLQEILYHVDYRFIDTIDEYNKSILKNEEKEETLDSFLDENIVVSPVMKRPFIQTLTIIDEITKIMGCEPSKYYIECTRTKQEEKKKTTSRYEKLKNQFAEAKKFAIEMGIDFNKLSKELEDKKDFIKSDAVFLYFSQLGRCMYSLQPIDLDDLLSSNSKYDIDHIYPQSLIKDDSIHNNKVLTLKSWNNKKQDNFIFEIEGFRSPKAIQYYNYLLDLKLINTEKHKRLTQKELKNFEFDNFVNRQLVVTNQAVKALITTLKLYKNVDASNIIFSKAENVSNFRNMYDILKSRTANNFHHAHDAYLNAVIGRALNEYYSTIGLMNHMDYRRLRMENKTINPMTVLSKNRSINGKVIWNFDYEIALLNKNIKTRFDIMETFRTYNPTGLFAKTTILPASTGDSIPVKENGPLQDTTKYGGITSNSFCKYIILSTTNKKGNKEYILEPIPKKYENRMDEYLALQGYTSFEILHNNIKSNIVIEQESKKFVITGKTGNRFLIKNVKDRIFSYFDILTIKKIDKYFDNLKKNQFMTVNDNEIIIAPPTERTDSIILKKQELNHLLDSIIEIFKKDIYSYSSILSIAQQLCDNRVFNIIELLYLINEILNLLKTNERKSADLTTIGMSKSSGILLISKTLVSGMKLISESVTGYYSKVLFEVPDGI